MECSEAIFILYVDPCFKLILEGRVVAIVFEILSRKGLKVQHVDLEFGEFVFEGCEMQEGGLIFLLEQR